MFTRPIKILPPPLPLKKMLGPSFILLGLGLGSGEIILWPYLVSNYGLGIAWGAALGITFQYFINLEIERYTLARGESVFVGLARHSRWVPYWLIGSTLLGFGWPGIIASSAVLLSSVFGGESTMIAIVLLLLIGLVLSFGKYIYTTVEHFSRLIILCGIPAIIILTWIFADGSDLTHLAQGIVGFGDGYRWLPSGISLATFLGAFAFSGAAGNLNLTQSSYIREKGYGMAAHTEKMKGLLNGQAQEINLNGHEFVPTEENVRHFRGWWRSVVREHTVVFYGLGLFTMLLLMLLSFATTFGHPGNAQGIQFVLTEARMVGEETWPVIGVIFAAVLGIMLFSTQFSVFDSTSRIMSENYAMIKMRSHPLVHLSKYYYVSLWLQIFFGVVVFALGIREPLKLLVLGASLNAVCMFVHIALVTVLNYRYLPRDIQPPLWRRLIILIAFLFFGAFSAFTLADFF